MRAKAVVEAELDEAVAAEAEAACCVTSLEDELEAIWAEEEEA